MRIATSGRPGPTVLEVPDDVFADEAVAASFAPTADIAVYPRLRSAPDPAEVRRAVELIRRNRRPMVIAGGGVLHAGAEAELLELVELLGCPVATSLTGKGAIPETHPLCVGVAGRFGVPMANANLEEADCVIFIGTKTGQTTTLNWTLPYLDVPVIHIDVDPTELGRNYHDTVPLVGDAKLGVAALVEGLRGDTAATTWDREQVRAQRDEWWDGPIAFKQQPVQGVLKPQDMIRVMREHMSDDDLFVSDASLASGWIAGRWQVRTTGRHFYAPRGLAGLGWGLPAAIGVGEATKTLPATEGDSRAPRIVCLAGDGGWGYSLTEIETATRRGLPLICVVLNNSTLGWIKHSAATRYPDAMVSQDFIDVSYSNAAKAMGAQVAFVDDLHQFDVALKSAFADETRRPWVIEARTCEIETPVLPSRALPPAEASAGKGGY